MKLPIGNSHFGEIIRKGYNYVDKTSFIALFLEEMSHVLLITRPRRWGKTMLLSMLEHFFSPEVNGASTRGLFDDLLIAQMNAEHYVRDYQGQYPVMSLSLKDVVRFKTFDQVVDKVAQEVSQCCQSLTEHLRVNAYLKSHQDEKICRLFHKLLEKKGSMNDVMEALYTVSHLLSRVYEKQVYILLDEYDMPLNRSYNLPYFDELSEFMKGFLSAGFKDNPHLAKGLITGILQVSQSSMLSGLNNLKVYTVLDKKYCEYFGFSEKEVRVLLDKAGLASAYEMLKHWYNGYRVDDLTLYNPWSIANYLDEKALKPYWINTGSNELIKHCLVGADSKIKTDLETMLHMDDSGHFSLIDAFIDPKVQFDRLQEDARAFWSLLLCAGYLTVESAVPDHRGFYHCKLRIPNLEVKGLYERYIEEWFEDNNVTSDAFIRDLIQGNVESFQEKLEYFLEQVVSYHDVGQFRPEKFYHGFVLGLVVGVRDYTIESNRESGLGRYDVMLLPKDPKKHTRAIIFEFKTAGRKEILEQTAEDALNQILQKRYINRCKAASVKEVLAIGLAFKDKDMAMRYKQDAIEEF